MSQQLGATRYVVASRDVVSEDFDGEFIVLDLGSGKYYSMDATASALWRAITAGVSIQALVEAVDGAATPINGPVIHDYAEHLVACGCLARLDASDSSPLDPAIAAVLRASSGLPKVETFSDLADLIKADPIHDVEETAGWPVRKLTAAE
jgi:coenzyme PQQ synthesis protein D (PqqD)